MHLARPGRRSIYNTFIFFKIMIILVCNALIPLRFPMIEAPLKNYAAVFLLLCSSCSNLNVEFVCLFVWVYGISTFVGYLMPNPFNINKQFHLKQFLFRFIQFSQTVLIQTIQFSISTQFSSI